MVLTGLATVTARPCSCRAQQPACAYIGADVIFRGKVSFTNDDGSGTFVQETRVRFDVEESFKGLTGGTRQVWIDPGSFTSCYQEYRPGNRYLVFARRGARMSADSEAVSLVPRRGKSKPLPPGIDPARPPDVYYAPECSGSRPSDDFPNIEADYRMLRDYREGRPLPRVFGYVFLAPFEGWPRLNGPKVAGAIVTVSNGTVTLKTTTKADGSFQFADAPAGVYAATARMAPFSPGLENNPLIVPIQGCGFGEATLRTLSRIEGIVLDQNNRPAAMIPVGAEVLSTPGDQYPVSIDTKTDKQGAFVLAGLPDTNVRLYYGTSHPSANGVRYPLAYYPTGGGASRASTFHLAPGEVRAGLVLRLAPILKIGTLSVRVVNSNGTSAANTFVRGILNTHVAESAQTGADGNATLSCLLGNEYHLEVGNLFQRSEAQTANSHVVCGKQTSRVTVTLRPAAK